MQAAGAAWWIYTSLFILVVMLFLQWLFPAFIAPLFNKFTPIEDKALEKEIESVLEKGGITVRGVYRMDASKRTKHSNAYFTGLGRVKRIVLTRPALEAGERLGFLPGSMEEKVSPYLRPLYDALHDMLDFDRVEQLMERGILEIAPIAFMRGRTLNDSFVILDEADYLYAREFLARHDLRGKVGEVIFSPAFGPMSPRTLTEWILRDDLDVRLGLQLHKFIWEPDARGV